LKKIIVDANIIFSCLLHSQGTIGELIFNSKDIFDFYSNKYVRFEIRKHWNKLKKISKSTDLELETAYDKMLTKLTFINEELIAQNDWKKRKLWLKI
jgi:predicted nucleic acid-binding protein